MIFLLWFSLITLGLWSQHKVRIEINSLPSNHPANSSIFIAGSFNGWNPRHKDYQFQKSDKGYSLELTINPGKHEFKVTRGGRTNCKNARL